MTTLTKNQTRTYGPRFYTENGTRCRITAKVRYDDDCGNGHNSFAITATIDEKDARGHWRDCAGGCLHNEVAKHFPELAPFIKWHLCASDGPMHYPGNVIYHAGARDCWGLLAGEESTSPRQMKHFVQFGNSPITHEVGKRLKAFIDSTIAEDGEFIIDKVEHGPSDHKFGPKFQFAGMGCQWHECPFDTCEEAREWLDAITGTTMHWTARTNVFGEGKARDLNAARSCAIWPDATDEDLTADGLEQRLRDRLPALLAEFQTAVESLGFTF